MKKLLIFLFLLAIFATMAYANISTLQLVAPTNASYDGDAVIAFTAMVNGTEAGTNYSCYLYDDRDGSYGITDPLYSNTSMSNATTGQIASLSSIADGTYLWTVGCNSTANSTIVFPSTTAWDLTTNSTYGGHLSYTYYVDDTNPSVTVNSPTSASWDTDGFIYWNLTVIDNNVAQCVLSTNLNSSTNTTGNWASKETKTYANNTWFNFTFGQTTNKWADNNTGNYIWNYVCNDTAGNTATLSSNYTFYVDTVAPTAPNLSGIYIGNAVSLTGWLSGGNGSTSTDYTPRINWTISTELNFSRYTVRIYNSTTQSAANLLIEANATTNKSIDYYIVTSNLDADKTHSINVTAYDVAGNSAESAYYYVYSTDSSCRSLLAGWNMCAYRRTTQRNASTIANETNAAYISKYQANHTFATFTTGASTNAGLTWNASVDANVIDGSSEVIWIYVNSAQTWEHELWQANANYIYYNLTNMTAEGWNAIPWYDRVATNFSQLDYSMNGNGTNILYTNVTDYMSMHMTNGSKYGFKSNWTYNHATPIDYGEAFWAWFDGTAWVGSSNYLWNSSGEI